MKRLIFGLATLLLTAACSQGPLGMNWNTPGTSTPDNSGQSIDNSFQTQALSILQKNCASCHGQNSGSGNVYNLDSPSHMIAAGLIVPGDPNRSLLFNEVATGSMPPSGPLSSADQLVLQNWIGTVKTTPTPPPTPGPSPTPTPAPSPSPNPPATGVTFTSVKNNILSVRCNSCHSFSTYSNVMKYVSAGKPTSSSLYTAINSGSMPKGSSKLSSAQIQSIYDWIAAGAKNN